MGLLNLQMQFVDDVMSKLIPFINSHGLLITFGECLRTVEQQKLYFDQGKSKTMDSQHIKKLAIDLNFFYPIKLTLISDRNIIKPIGDYWESISIQHRWCGSWRGLIDSGKSSFIDIPHFEIKD